MTYHKDILHCLRFHSLCRILIDIHKCGRMMNFMELREIFADIIKFDRDFMEDIEISRMISSKLFSYLEPVHDKRSASFLLYVILFYAMKHLSTGWISVVRKIRMQAQFCWSVGKIDSVLFRLHRKFVSISGQKF
jgi:hypothetical protein